MRSRPWSGHRIIALPCLVLAAGATAAQDPPPDAAPASAPAARTAVRMDRLFLNFVEDATIVNRQWWEGQAEYSDSDLIDTILLRGVAAFQPMANLELGGRVGFGTTDTPSGFPEGTGATDLDLWGKYYFGTPGSSTEFAAGAIVTVPTGDDTAGLGFDSFGVGAFGSLRYNAKRMILTGKIGLRMNGDGSILGSGDIDGDTSASVGAGVIWPWNQKVGLVGEINYEDGRFEGADSDSRALAGIQCGLGQDGLLRGAVSFGLSDGAPDFQVLAGYATMF
jgi:hypothetical protein